MTSSRRQFIQLAAAAGAAAALGNGLTRSALACATPAPAGGSGKGKRILILGGTGFIGPETMAAAVARGHTVGLFNRGRTQEARKKSGREVDIPEGVEVYYGNRDPLKRADDWKDESKGEKKDPDSPLGLESLKGTTWDAVVDNSGYYPRMVKASAELLAPNAGQYIFISSISALAKNDVPNQDETAPVGTIPDPTVETMGAQFENYGPLKALCEQAAEAAFKGRCTNIRPGYIVGPGDPTARFTYWPVRVARGGEVLAPGTAEDPVQVIDVRDLAEFIVTCVENKTVGMFHATGPDRKLSVGETLEACRAASNSDATFLFAPAEFLMANEFMGALPIFIPPVGEYAGFHSVNVQRAIKAGLKFRPIGVTAKDTLAWFNGPAGDTMRKRLSDGFPSAEKEKELIEKLKAWKK